jgi:4-phytase / acid phosphatase
MRGRWLLPLLAIACALPQIVSAKDAGTLKLEIVLIRHGVRSPTSAPEALGKYSREAWPAWPVEPGVLTEHGAQGMQSIGQRYRERYHATGLWDGDCATASEVVVIADSTPRNRDSAAALGKGLGGDCGLGFYARPSGENNRLFHYQTKDNDDADDAQADGKPPTVLSLLQDILLGCSGDDCRKAALADGKKLLLDDPAGNLSRAMKAAGSLSENLMLEYAQGMPLGQVAWGKGDATTIGRLIELHNLQFAQSKKPLPLARKSASNLLAHIVASLDTASGKQGDVEPLSDGRTRVVFLIGHDTNLAQISGLLGADWHSAAQPDDYPPGGALVFDLWEKQRRYAVQVHTLLPTLDALRHADVSHARDVVDVPVAFGDCHAATPCPIDTFRRWTTTRILSSEVEAKMPQMQRSSSVPEASR